MNKWYLIFFCIFTWLQTARAGEVQSICGKGNFKVIELEYRQGRENYTKIKTSLLGEHPAARYLKQFYTSHAFPQPEAQIVNFVNIGNSQHLKNSDLKKKFLNYATTQSRKADPVGYRNTILELINTLVPKDLNKIDWFLTLKDSAIASTAVEPASGKELNDVYGATARIMQTADAKFSLKIIFSNNESEPIPYLIPLMIHELQHVVSYKDKIALNYDEKKLTEYNFVEEAKAFDIQMQTYIALAKKYPELFCNWLYETYSYGEIPVALSWTMASMEKEMISGRYIYEYAKMGGYKNSPFLLNNSGTDLRVDLRDKIKKMNLVYVK